MKIEQAQNGFVVTTDGGDLFIYRTLQEMADAIEGRAYAPAPVSTPTVYAPGKNAQDLYTVRRLAKEGRKIDAIKELRNVFEPRLGLKEAKELIEDLCACY